MCEWLSSGDWFDVQILCGGRSFSAHRAVLASVSNFLRKVLLSCPEDESPLFIYLTDFDHDAICSLLYYIYNGEVSVPKNKLQMFLDMANAMEVHIPETNDLHSFEREKIADNNVMVKDCVCELKLRNRHREHWDDINNDEAIYEDANEVRNGSHLTKTKVTILNEVLQCPWRPRQPNNYKPFRKKHRSYSYVLSEKQRENMTDEENFKDKNTDSQYKKSDTDISSENHTNTVCQQDFTSREEYYGHEKQHLSVNRYSCGECHKTFSQLRNFKYHMSVHRGTKEFATTCPVCGKHFNDRGYLSSHMKIHKNRKEYKCGSCPKSFNQRVAYNMHVRIHTGVKPHVCEECGKAFSRKMLLKQHQRTHSGERPYACSHCDKRFADRSNMTLHLRLHTGVKPFSCTLCPKSFTKKHHLKAHLNFHTGAKPYSCPRCKLAFTQSSNMRTHYKKCEAECATNQI